MEKIYNMSSVCAVTKRLRGRNLQRTINMHISRDDVAEFIFFFLAIEPCQLINLNIDENMWLSW